MISKYHFKFEDLQVYQKAMDFGETVDKLVKDFPKHGFYAQFVKHINHAIYSANECVSCNSKVKRRGYVNFSEDEKNRKMISEMTKMMSSLRKKILERKTNT
ncbi:MAG: hypothetical protein ACI9M9_000021 [Flavobacteriaceae bacterium]|jgi:hypothetical protein